MLNFANNANKSGDGNEPRPLIKNGTYNAKIVKADITNFKGNDQINITFEIQGGEFDKRYVFYHVKKDKNNPDQFDSFGIMKVICFGQGWDNSNKALCDELTKKGVRVTFEDYDDLVQYLNSGLAMQITTMNEADRNTGKFYPNPRITNFAPIGAAKNTASAPAKSAPVKAPVIDSDDDLPF